MSINPLAIAAGPIVGTTIAGNSTATVNPNPNPTAVANPNPTIDTSVGPPVAVDNTSLTRAAAALSIAIAAMRPPLPQIATSSFHNPFVLPDSFDLSSCSGAVAYQLSSSPLDELWERGAATFHSFVVSLRIRAREGKWNTGVPQGILDIGGQDILIEYHSITDTEIEAARTARKNSQSVQNSKAMFRCIKSSIKGDLKDTIFTQYENLSEHEDGISLFK